MKVVPLHATKSTRPMERRVDAQRFPELADIEHAAPPMVKDSPLFQRY